MPKRSAEECIEGYRRNIRKLSVKIGEKRVRFEYEGSESASPVTNAASPAADAAPTPEPEPTRHASVPEPEIMIDLTSEPDIEDRTLIEETAATSQAEDTMPEVAIDPELLEALGESTSKAPEYGEKIHEDLSTRWLPLLRKGITKEDKDRIQRDYLIPDNCRLLQSPTLNPEISAAVPDLVRNRDKELASQQQQLGTGITAVNRSLDLLLKGGDKIQTIRHLSDACRILSDLHATFTHDRVKLITPCLDNKFLHVIQDTQRDETLFGNKLADKINAANAIEKQGRTNNLKNTNASQPTSNKTSTSGNWSAPPPYLSNRGGCGGSRKGTSWDPQLVLNYVSEWSPNSNLTLDKITKKLVFLLAICTTHRVHRVHNLYVY